MKKSFLIFCLVIISIALKAQIILEHSYTGVTDGRIIELDNSVFKYAVTDVFQLKLRLYNLNHSLWKTIDLVPPVANYQLVDQSYGRVRAVQYISQTLFDTDSLIECMVVWSSNGAIVNTVTEVINENGNVLMNFKWGAMNYAYVSTTGNDSFKLVSEIRYVTSLQDSINVYSLPGTIPCDVCNGGISGMINDNGNSNDSKMMLYPNPTNNYAKISYSLPTGINSGEIIIYSLEGKEIKSFKVDRTFNELLLSTEDLSSGTYLYSLKTSDAVIQTKKMVVIK